MASFKTRVLVLVSAYAGLALLLAWLSPDSLELPLQFSLLRCLPEFLIGCALAFQFAEKRGFRNDVTPIESRASNLRFSLSLLLILLLTHFGLADLVVVAAMAVMIHEAPTTSGFLRHVLNAKVLVWIGGVSYAIYLVHMLVQSSWRVVALQVSGTHILLGPGIDFACRIVIIIVLASILYVFMELPARQVIRRKLLLNSNSQGASESK